MWMHNIDYFKYDVFIHINKSIYVYFMYISFISHYSLI